MKIKKSRIKEIIREEINEMSSQEKLNEELTPRDYTEIKDIIRSEIAAIFFELYRKKQMWI